MDIPKKVFIARFDITNASFELPDGKLVDFNRSTIYETVDPVELDFFSKQKGMAVRDLTDKEVRTWITSHPYKAPLITNRKLTFDDVRDLVWEDEAEQAIVDILLGKQYIVYRRKAKRKKKVVEE